MDFTLRLHCSGGAVVVSFLPGMANTIWVRSFVWLFAAIASPGVLVLRTGRWYSHRLNPRSLDRFLFHRGIENCRVPRTAGPVPPIALLFERPAHCVRAFYV